MMVNDWVNLILIVLLTAEAILMWPRRFPAQVLALYWIQIAIIPFIPDKQIYSSAYTADLIVLALGVLSADKLGLPVAIISACFMVGHIVGYTIYLENGSPFSYDLCLTGLYVILLQQFYVKGARDGAYVIARRLWDSRCDKAHNDGSGRGRRGIPDNDKNQKVQK